MINNQIILFKFIQINNKVVNWVDVYYNYKLSENFIIEFKNKIDWWCILNYQKLSEKFKEEFKNKFIICLITK